MKLKPCQLCGAEAKIVKYDLSRYAKVAINYLCGIAVENLYTVRCTGCRAETQQYYEAEAAINAWNEWDRVAHCIKVEKGGKK